jgi:hypothetical protein
MQLTDATVLLAGLDLLQQSSTLSQCGQIMQLQASRLLPIYLTTIIITYIADAYSLSTVRLTSGQAAHAALVAFTTRRCFLTQYFGRSIVFVTN